MAFLKYFNENPLFDDDFRISMQSDLFSLTLVHNVTHFGVVEYQNTCVLLDESSACNTLARWFK
jgi:hypothetical protein